MHVESCALLFLSSNAKWGAYSDTGGGKDGDGGGVVDGESRGGREGLSMSILALFPSSLYIHPSLPHRGGRDKAAFLREAHRNPPPSPRKSRVYRKIRHKASSGQDDHRILVSTLRI